MRFTNVTYLLFLFFIVFVYDLLLLLHFRRALLFNYRCSTDKRYNEICGSKQKDLFAKTTHLIFGHRVSQTCCHFSTPFFACAVYLCYQFVENVKHCSILRAHSKTLFSKTWTICLHSSFFIIVFNRRFTLIMKQFLSGVVQANFFITILWLNPI